jgi:ElaB/YqjD/DUF883 family membrane-anchored ribosome-binding protein
MENNMFVSEKEKNEKDKNIKNFNEAGKEAIRLKDETVSYIKSNTEDAVNEVQDKARAAGQNVYDFFKRNGAKIKDSSETASSAIRHNPLASAGAIFATGLIIGAILKSGRKA